jgi:hypothetical protein
MSSSRDFRLAASSTLALAALLLAGCGGNDAETRTADETASAEEGVAQPEPRAPAQSAEPAGNATTAPLTTDDIARWEKGLDAEMQAVQEAGTRLKTARTGEDTLNVMMGVQEMNTVEAGARAAGLDPERYKFVRSSLSSVVKSLTPALGGIDTTMLSQAQRDELRQGSQAEIERMQKEVPPEVVTALKPRAEELRKKDMELAFTRLKAAGMQ